jgi:hypothetical protein
VIDREKEERDRDNTRGKVMEMLLLLWDSFSEKNEGCGMKILEKNCQGWLNFGKIRNLKGEAFPAPN